MLLGNVVDLEIAVPLTQGQKVLFIYCIISAIEDGKLQFSVVLSRK